MGRTPPRWVDPAHRVQHPGNGPGCRAWAPDECPVGRRPTLSRAGSRTARRRRFCQYTGLSAFARDDPQADRGPTTGVLNYLIDLVLYGSLSTKNEVDEFVASRHTKSGKSWFVGALAQINTE